MMNKDHARISLGGINASVGGNIIDPETIYISDSQFTLPYGYPEQFGATPGEQFVAVSGGRVEHAIKYIELRAEKLKTARYVFLHMGTNNLCKLKGFGPQPLVAFDPRWGEPPKLVSPGSGYLQGPDELAMTVANKLERFARRVKECIPGATVVTTDPPARRTRDGFANSRVRATSHHISQQSSVHHHIRTWKKYLGNNSHNHKGNPGGRYPLRERFFSDGVHYTKQELKLFFKTMRMARVKLDVNDTNGDEMLSPNWFDFKI